MSKVKFLVVGLLVWGLINYGKAFAQGPVQTYQQLAAAMQLVYSYGYEGNDCLALANTVYNQALPTDGVQIAQAAYVLTKQMCTLGHQDRTIGLMRATQVFSQAYQQCLRLLGY